MPIQVGTGSFVYLLAFVDGRDQMAKRTTACLVEALRLAAEFGWKTFPAKVKTKSSYLAGRNAPDGERWGATNDPKLLRKNFLHPEWWLVCGLGLPTGETNGIVVVEADTAKGHKVDGLASMQALEARFGTLPTTRLVQSPSGSRHWYFKRPAANKVWNSASFLAPGIDVRGDGGMVLIPPTKRTDGLYTWLSEALVADMPTWLADLVMVQPTPRVSEAKQREPLNFFEQLGEAQSFQESLDIEAMLDGLIYPGNVHQTERDVIASLVSRGVEAEEAIEYVIDQIKVRIPEAERWNWGLGDKGETGKLRRLIVDWMVKHPDLLELQEAKPEWLTNNAKIKPLLNGAGNGFDRSEADKPTERPTLVIVKSTELEKLPAERPTWLVPNLILEEALNGFFGDGGTGKDLLLLQLGMAMTCGKQFLGMDVMQGRVLYFNVEDPQRHLRWRQYKIMENLVIDQSSDDLWIVPMYGQDTMLATINQKSGMVVPTKLFSMVCEVVESFQPKLVVVGNRVNIFNVNQNDDAQARQCLNQLNKIIDRYRTTVIMPAHPSLGQISSGTGSSGSVQWSNGCRQRLYLSRPKKETDENGDPIDDDNDQNARILEVLKSNWGPSGDGINIRWNDWIFTLDKDFTIEGKPPQGPTDDAVENEFLRMLDIAENMGQTVSATPRARNNAPTVFSESPSCRYRFKTGRKLLQAAMERLFDKGKIRREQYGPPSDRTFRIVR